MGKLRILPLLLALLLTAALPASAADYDSGREGSVTVTLRQAGKPVSGVRLVFCRVGSIQDGPTLSYAPLPEFSGISLDNPGREELPDLLLARIREAGISGREISTDSGGAARLTAADHGLYLVYQAQSREGFLDIVPFLAAVPMSTDTGWRYDVEALPKVAPEPEPTVPSTPGGGGKPPLIQTGQLNWPVPVLAVSGLLLFSLGWAMAFLRDKRR